MGALESELQRSVDKLKTAGEAPLYFLAYRVYDVEEVSISGSYGAIDGRRQGGRQRHLDVELRVGTRSSTTRTRSAPRASTSAS
jgi:hypothetical protein